MDQNHLNDGTTPERLRRARERLGKTQMEMGELTGVSGRSWQDYEAGKAMPKVSVYERLAALGFNPEWLLVGEGPMFGRSEILPTGVSGEDYVALPRYDVRAAAGLGAVVEQEQVVDWIYFKRDWLRRTLGVSPSELAIIEAVGDSMAPTIDDGDLLLVDVGEPKLRGEGIYVIAVDDALIVKRIAIKLGGGLVISSDNPHYHGTRQELGRGELEFLRIIGRVVWVGGRI